MTELRHADAKNAVPPPFASRTDGRWPARSMIRQGVAGLILGAALTFGAVAWSQGVLGFLALVTVLGSLGWIGLGVVRRAAARLRRR